jgi:hypothetical protein
MHRVPSRGSTRMTIPRLIDCEKEIANIGSSARRSYQTKRRNGEDGTASSTATTTNHRENAEPIRSATESESGHKPARDNRRDDTTRQTWAPQRPRTHSFAHLSTALLAFALTAAVPFAAAAASRAANASAEMGGSSSGQGSTRMTVPDLSTAK